MPLLDSSLERTKLPAVDQKSTACKHQFENDQQQQLKNGSANWPGCQVVMVPGNLHAALQVFDGQDVGEVSQNHLCPSWHKESILLPEV